MQAVGGLVTAFNLVLALVITIRLLRLGAISASILLLTFFPTPAYRRFVARSVA